MEWEVHIVSLAPDRWWGEDGGYPVPWPSAVRQGTHEALVGLDKPPGRLDGQHPLVLLGDPPLKLQGQTYGVGEGEEAGGGAAHLGGLEENAFVGVQLQLQWLLPALQAHLLGPEKGGQYPGLTPHPWIP